MELSLDDIIKSKRIGSIAPSKKFINNKKNAPLRKPLKSTPKLLQERITDARMKIIQNNRAKIRDARDKLAEITRASGDARQRLQRKQQVSGVAYLKANIYRNGHIRNGTKPYEHKTFPKSFRHAAHARSRPDRFEMPRGYVDYDNMERMEEEEYAAASRLSRTVLNDEMEHYSSYVDTRDSVAKAPRRNDSWESNSTKHFDPFDVYELPVNAKNNRQIRRISPDHDLALSPPHRSNPPRPSSRQRSPADPYDRRFGHENSTHLSYEMRSRLERAPDPHASMGIFAKELPSALSSGYRIVVSNLHASVSQADIKELFLDIGELYDSRIVRPGVAEVIYKSLTDAEKAVDTYHNRQLDGLPMKCLLVNPRASNKPTAPAIKASSSTSSSRQLSEKTPLEIDIDALHKVLFRRH